MPKLTCPENFAAFIPKIEKRGDMIENPRNPTWEGGPSKPLFFLLTVSWHQKWEMLLFSSNHLQKNLKLVKTEVYSKKIIEIFSRFDLVDINQNLSNQFKVQNQLKFFSIS